MREFRPDHDVGTGCWWILSNCAVPDDGIDQQKRAEDSGGEGATVIIACLLRTTEELMLGEFMLLKEEQT
jgi:hypothetical protein